MPCSISGREAKRLSPPYGASVADDDLSDDRLRGAYFRIVRRELLAHEIVARGLGRLGIRHQPHADAASAGQPVERAAVPVDDRAAIGLIEAGQPERLAVE